LSGLLLAGPIIAVGFAKRTGWEPLLVAPETRTTGTPNAKVVIVEFSDFQCPVCARVDPSIHGLLDRYKSHVRFSYKYYPLMQIHKNAMPSARAAECAARQNRFWPYHDRLFQMQISWASLPDPTTSFMSIANDIGLDLTRFGVCYAEPATLVPIERDIREARRRQVRATPTFFVDEDRLVGASIETEGARVIERHLKVRHAH
jgi:protein-disulfide isomerase